MSNRVTLQEIADSLGLSRNTVSRALNNTGNVSATTRNKICQAAVAMGYKQFVSADTAAPTVENHPLTAGAKSEIALFTHAFPGSSHSGTKMLEAFHHKVDSLGYKLSINIILTSFLLGFGGISVLLQVLSITSKTDLSIKPYILGKLLHGIISSFYTYIFINIIPFFNFDI